MGREARARLQSVAMLRHCDGCGEDRPAASFRRIKAGTSYIDAEVCASCELRWVAQGFLHKARLEAK